MQPSVGQQLFHALRAGHEDWGGHQMFLRSEAGAIFSASRYLATVRRATWMPCSSSICDSWLSDSGLRRVFGRHQLLDQRAHRGAADALPPASVFRLLPKKYFSSKVP
jgi:hypothetical protein